ncbi:MAG: hypothetical protein ACO1PZ_12165 [Gammaproteobacteria bacterium]
MIVKRLSLLLVTAALAACGGDATAPASSAESTAASAAAPAATVAQGSTATATPVVACDRACLEGFVECYFDALIDNDPSKVPLAEDVIFTEDGQRLLIGDGLWNTMKSKGPYRLFTTDVPAGQVAVLATINEDHRDPALETPALIAVRLKVENQTITQIEQLVVRSESAANNVNNIGTPHEIYLTEVPPENRMSRAAMIETANKYFTGMQQNDGKGDYPFAEDCHRIENGMAATNNPTPEGETRPDPKTALGYSGQWTCLEQFESGLIHFVHRIRDRRFVAVDEERGIVFSFVFFDHPGGDTRTFQVPDGRTVTAGPVQPWTWQIAELFKVENNQIRRIEAIIARSPYGMNSGWSTWEEGMSDEMRDVTME